MINKKFTLKKLLAIVMVVAVIFGCIGCTKDTGSNTDTGNNTNSNNDNNTTDKYEGLSDAEYFQALTEEALSDVVGAVASSFGNVAEMGVLSGDFGASAEMTLQLGDPIMDLLGTYVASSLGAEMDISFLSEIGLTAQIDSYSDLTQLILGLGLSDTEIIALDMIVSEDTLWAGIPGLSDVFLETKMDDMVIASDATQSEMMAKLMSAFPEEKEIDRILTRYLSMALKEIDKVERTQTTLELDGLKQDVTQLNVKIYAEDGQDMLKVILTTVKEDESIKKIVDDFAVVYNEMGREQSADWEDMDLYAQFTAAIDAFLGGEFFDEIDDIYYIDAYVYIDSKHNVVGISAAREAVDSKDADDEECFTFFNNYTVTEGENFKELLEIVPAGVKITGSGTSKMGVVNGKYDVTVLGTSYLTIDLKDFDANVESVSGVAVLTPTENLVDLLGLGSGTIIPMDDIALELAFDVAEGIVHVETKLVGKDAMIFGVILKLADKEVTAVEKPTNSVSVLDQQALMSWVAELDLTSVFANLRKAGVPEELVVTLEGLTQMIG